MSGRMGSAISVGFAELDQVPESEGIDMGLFLDYQGHALQEGFQGQVGSKADVDAQR